VSTLPIRVATSVICPLAEAGEFLKIKRKEVLGTRPYLKGNFRISTGTA
jgi:hypothetical protein